MTMNRKSEDGFTLIELLVVMLIIAVLAAIAIPVFLSQRAKAHDASTIADVTNVGKEVSTYFVDGTGTLTLDFAAAPGRVLITDGSYSASVNLTNGTAAPSSGTFADLGDPNGWCVALTDPAGSIRDFRYTAADGLEPGTC